MTSGTLVTLTLFLVFIGVPVAFALGAVGVLVGYFTLGPSVLLSAPQIMFTSVNSFLLLAVPLFLLMSEIMNRSGITEELFDAAASWMRHLPAGLAVATVITSAIGAAITGSSIANAATMSNVAIPALIKRGYDRRFVYGLIAGTGTLGILIPPSIPLILYAAITGESVGRLFLAAIVPGLFLVLLMLIYVVARGVFGNIAQREERATWGERWRATRRAFWGLLLPPIILGGMYSGIFTPTEAAAVGCVYAAAVAAIGRRIAWRDVGPILIRTAVTTSMVLLIAAGALILGHVVTVLQIPQTVVRLVVDAGFTPLGFVIMVCVLLIVLGCILEVISLIFILVPVLFPVLLALGIDPIWFAILFVITLELAQLTPPVGILLHVVRGIANAPLGEIIQGVMPFIGLLLLTLVALIAVPDMALWIFR